MLYKGLPDDKQFMCPASLDLIGNRLTAAYNYSNPGPTMMRRTRIVSPTLTNVAPNAKLVYVKKSPMLPAISSKRPMIVEPINNVPILLLLKLKRLEQSIMMTI